MAVSDAERRLRLAESLKALPLPWQMKSSAGRACAFGEQ